MSLETGDSLLPIEEAVGVEICVVQFHVLCLVVVVVLLVGV